MYTEPTFKQAKAIEAMRTKGIYPDRLSTNPYWLLSVDPGKTSGWARFADNGHLTDWGHTPSATAGIKGFLQDCPIPGVIIYEVYQIRGRAQSVGHDAIATRAVCGILREYARKHEIPCVGMQASNKPIAQKWTGLFPEGSHSNSHWVDGVNHGWYYLNIKKMVVPTMLWDSK